MGYEVPRAIKARIIELARQAEAAGQLANKTRIAQTVSRDRGVIIREIAKWEAAGKPAQWPTDAPAIAQPPPAQPEPPPDVYAAILEFAKENRIPIPAAIYQAAGQSRSSAR